MVFVLLHLVSILREMHDCITILGNMVLGQLSGRQFAGQFVEERENGIAIVSFVISPFQFHCFAAMNLLNASSSGIEFRPIVGCSSNASRINVSRSAFVATPPAEIVLRSS
jgi:hypothetical protein